MTINFAFILPTTQCQGHCRFCFYETGHSPRVDSVDYLEPLDLALTQLCEEGLQQVIISGGEPLLSPQLPQLIELCNAKVVHLLLLTNGELLDEAMLARLEQLGLDDLTISAHEINEQLSATVRRALFRSRFMPNLLTTLTSDRLDQITPLLKLSTQLNLSHLFTPAYIPRSSSVFDELSLRRLDDEQWHRVLDELGPWAMQTGSASYLEMVRGFYDGLPVNPGFCPMGTQGMVIDADGSVYPCFHRHDLKAGNLLVDPWPSIHEKLVRAGEELYHAPCFDEQCLSMFAGMRDVSDEELDDGAVGCREPGL